MSITIGGVLLDKDMFWTDEYNWNETVGASGRTLEYGAEVVQSYQVSGGRPITLQGDANHGWQLKSTVDLLLNLSNQPAQTYTLDYHTHIYTVRFVHEEPPAVAFAPVTVVTDPADDFWYTGTIKLKVVG